MLNTVKHILTSKGIRNKILFTIGILIIYRFFVFTPVPFVDIATLKDAVNQTTGGMQFFAMLMGWSLKKFSIIALWLIPFINASIILQLLTVVIPHLEELKEEWETGNMKIQQYTRRLTFPLAFLQAVWMVYLISTYIPWVINTSSFAIVLSAAFALTVWTVLLIWLGEMITEKWISNGISLLIFASIISGMTSSFMNFMNPNSWGSLLSIFIFIIVIVLVLIVLSILLIRTIKEIPITYARAGKIQETATLPIPLNPVWMIPIIFAIAFVSFPYLLWNILYKFNPASPAATWLKDFTSTYFNIYTQNPYWTVVLLYFVLIVLFTFFYSWVTFKPEKMAEQIQKRGGYIAWIRPGEDTANYINSLLNHLCFWWGIWLWIVGIYTYVINWIPFIQDTVRSGWLSWVPVIVSGAWVIIIVWVVQEIINKLNADLLMEKYSKIV